MGKFDGKTPLGRPRSRREANIKMDFQEVGGGSIDWTDLAQDQGEVAGTCKCSKEPLGSTKCREFLD